MDKLKKKIIQAFKLSGYVIRSDNALFLAEQLLPFDSSEHDKWLNTVIENIQNLKLDSANIDRSTIETAIGEINRVGLQEHETIFSVIDALGDIPRYNYNTVKKKFELDRRTRQMMPDIAMLSEYLCQRYNMLHQKTIRHELFAPPVLQKSVIDDTKKFKLYTAENLLASSEVKEAVIMGQLNEIEEGKLFIEDPTGYVELDLSAARYHSGFYCEGCFVLAEGSYENSILKVDGLGFPPAEPASSSRAFFGTANTWGGPSKKLLKYSTALQEIERENTEATMVFLSDVRLDNPEVIKKMRKLFLGYDSCPPVCIVLMGPLCTTLHTNYYNLRPLIKELIGAANGCDQLKKETDLILIPDIDDPVNTPLLPRLAIPEPLCEDLIKAWPRTKLATNPCRLQYCTQQIVVFRMDLMGRLMRNTIHYTEDGDMNNDLVRTLICQGHLAPFTRHKIPILWDFDSSLWLYPLPDLVVLGDSCPSFNITQHGCTFVNTGSFSQSNYTFKMYIPSQRTVEDSEIPEFDIDEQDKEPEETEDQDEVMVIPSTGITTDFAKTVDTDGAVPTIDQDEVEEDVVERFPDEDEDNRDGDMVDDDGPSTSAAAIAKMAAKRSTNIDLEKPSGSGVSSKAKATNDIADIEDILKVSGLSLGVSKRALFEARRRVAIETNAGFDDDIEVPTEVVAKGGEAQEVVEEQENADEDEDRPDGTYASPPSSVGSEVEYDPDRVDELNDYEVADDD